MKSLVLSPAVAVGAVAAMAALMGAVEVTALQTKERRELQPHRIDRAYCTQCHSDQRSIMMMQLKEGQCAFLFSKTEKQGVAKRLASYSPTPQDTAGSWNYSKKMSGSDLAH